MSLSIIKPGLFDTIQDLGRTGHSCCGINPGGAMDFMAARLANALVGNEETAAVLEIHFPGPQILIGQDTLISLAGADFSPTLNNEAIPCWQPVFIKKNTVLQFTGKKWGARVYLAVRGGFCISKWLNSYSTNTVAAMGGHCGRKLEKGDTLAFKEAVCNIHRYIRTQHNSRVLPWRPAVAEIYRQPASIHFLKGNEWEVLSCCSKKSFHENSFGISTLSDRMGYHLDGGALTVTENKEIVSSAVTHGTLQLLPGGRLVVLMADHQTTGGYPRIGHVITAHLPKLAQLCAGERIQFVATELERAEEMLFLQQHTLAIMQRACVDHINDIL